MANKKFGTEPNPLAVLFKILVNALLDDRHGISVTAYNALMILAALVDKNLPAEIDKKSTRRGGRYRYDR